MSELDSKLVFVLNDNPELEFDRSAAMSESQLTDLDRLEHKMDAGILLETTRIENPSPGDRATYMANQLVSAYREGKEGISAICMAYLATRQPELKQIKAHIHPDRITIQLLFDRPYSMEQRLEFVHKDRLLNS